MDVHDPTKIDHLAGFWWRGLGFTIDSVILLVAVGLPLKGLHLTFYVALVLNVMAAYFYGSLFIGLNNGQTLGMKWVNIQCVNAADQAKVSLEQAFRRSTVYCAFLLVGGLYQVHTYVNPTTQQVQESAHQLFIFFVFATPHLFELLWAAWDKKNQTLHDKFAGTVVLRPKRTFS
jgi:uncharacterized RDD family membrane protein YckC